MKFVLKLFVLFFFKPLFAQESTIKHSCFPVWHGFQHEWTYNHRLNRIGSATYIQNDSIYHLHGAASGIGADSIAFNDPFVIVKTDKKQYREIRQDYQLYGKEGKHIVVKDTVLLEDRNQLPFLNGFDLWSETDADKIRYLEIAVKSLDDFQQAAFEISVQFNASCKSLECKPFQKLVAYKLSVFIGMISDASSQDSWAVSQDFQWNKRASFDASKPPVNKIEHENVKALPIIQSFVLDLSKNQWFCNWNCSIAPFEEDSAATTYVPKLGFAQWKPGMKKNAVSRKHARFAQRRKGSGRAVLSGQWLLLESADYESSNHAATFFWPAGKVPAGREAAVRYKRFGWVKGGGD